MESKSKEGGVNDEGVVSCENQSDEAMQTSLQKSQDCTLEISNFQVSLNLNNVEGNF